MDINVMYIYEELLMQMITRLHWNYQRYKSILLIMILMSKDLGGVYSTQVKLSTFCSEHILRKTTQTENLSFSSKAVFTNHQCKTCFVLMNFKKLQKVKGKELVGGSALAGITWFRPQVVCIKPKPS